MKILDGQGIGKSLLPLAMSVAENRILFFGLGFMVAGDPDKNVICLPVFQVLGKNIVHTGGSSSGQVVKSPV